MPRKTLWQRLGLRGKKQAISQETSGGVVLKEGAALPIEIYTDERIAEFQKNNEDVLKRYIFKKRS